MTLEEAMTLGETHSRHNVEQKGSPSGRVGMGLGIGLGVGVGVGVGVGEEV